MTEESFGERLRRLRKERRMGQRALASAVGKSKTWLVHLETGQRWQGKLPPLDDLRRVAEVLNMTVSELVGFSTDEERPLKPALSLVPKHQLTDDELFDKIGAQPFEAVPLVEGVFASAGSGIGLPQDIDDTVPRRMRKKRTDRFRWIPVRGRCMATEIMPGDLVLLDRDGFPESGDIVIAMRDEEELLIKRLTVRGQQRCLISNDGQEIAVDERIRILGPAVLFQRGLRR